MKLINTTNNRALLISLCATTLLATGCKEPDPAPDCPVCPSELSPQDMIAGTWKLTAFVDAKAGETTVPEPEECEGCYVLIINKNETCAGTSSTNTFTGKYTLNDDASITQLTINDYAKELEYPDGDLYVRRLRAVDSCSLADEKLHLFYNNKTNYLSYKRIEPLEEPVPSPPPPPEVFPKTITPVQIVHGNMQRSIVDVNIIPTQKYLITNRLEWEYFLWLMENASDGYENFSETNIDFTKYQIIGAVEDIYYDIEDCGITIAEITEYADNIVVTYNIENGYAKKDNRLRPFHLVKVPASDKEILFRNETAGDEEPLEMAFMGYPLEVWRTGYDAKLDYSKVTIVNSMEELGEYFNPKVFYGIDFSRHTLLLTMTDCSRNIENLDVALLKNSSNRYTLKVRGWTNFYSRPAPNWIIGVLIPKISSSFNIVLDINIEDCL